MCIDNNLGGLFVVFCLSKLLRSKSVSEAILVEVKPHLEKLRKVRGGLQKAVDEAKALRPYYTS